MLESLFARSDNKQRTVSTWASKQKPILWFRSKILKTRPALRFSTFYFYFFFLYLIRYDPVLSLRFIHSCFCGSSVHRRYRNSNEFLRVHSKAYQLSVGMPDNGPALPKARNKQILFHLQLAGKLWTFEAESIPAKGYVNILYFNRIELIVH